MQPVKARPAKHDPAPSRWAYRMHRLWLTPVFRRLVRVGLPFCLTLIAGTIYFSDEARRDAILLTIADMREEIHSRPEFMVELMAVDGAGEATGEDIREIVPVDFPISSFDLDLEMMRQDIVALPAVKDASVRIRNGGVLQIDVTERQPVAVWRSRAGLKLVDAEGVVIGEVAHRGVRADLPLVAGTDRRGAEALCGGAAAGGADARARPDGRAALGRGFGPRPADHAAGGAAGAGAGAGDRAFRRAGHALARSGGGGHAAEEAADDQNECGCRRELVENPRDCGGEQLSDD